MDLQRFLGLAPSAVPPQVFALRPGALTGARIERSNGRFELREHRSVEVSPDLFGEGPLGGAPVDPAALTEAVGGLLTTLSTTPREASLLVPDAWLRLAFVDLEERPRRSQERDEVLRWRLAKLVPFRVEDLRIQAVDSVPLPGQSEQHRLLVGFALERLLQALEATFSDHGVRLGQIVNESLAVARLLPLESDGGVTALVYTRGGEVSQLFGWHGEVVFHRHKRLEVPDRESESVRRDLLLTRSFLEDAMGGTSLDRLLLLADRDRRARWSDWLEGVFGREPQSLGPDDLPLAADAPLTSWLELAPLVGVAMGQRL